MDIITIILLIVGLIYAGLLFLHPKLSFYLLIFLCIIQFDWFIRYFNAPGIVGRLTYFAAMHSGIIIILDVLTKKIKIQKKDDVIKSVFIFIGLLIAIVLVSNFYNRESLVLGIYEIRYYLIMGILCTGFYYYQLFDLSEDQFIKLLLYLALLQIPFSLLQYILAGGGAIRTLDSVTGTFTSYGSLVCNQILVMGLILTYNLKKKKSIININNNVIIFLLLIPIVLSKSRSATGFAVIMLFFVFCKDALSKRNMSVFINNIVIAVAFIFFFISIFYYFFWQNNYNIQKQLNISYIVSYFTRDPLTSKQRWREDADPRMGRARSIIEAVKLSSQNTITFMIGRGSGSVSEASFLGKNGRFYQHYGPLAGIWRTQYSKIISEIGFLGLFLFIYLFYRIYSIIKSNGLNNSLICESYYLIIFIVIIFSIYFRLLDSFYFSILLALFLGSLKTHIYTFESQAKNHLINSTR